MPERGAMFPERRVQPGLSFSELFQLLAFLLTFYALWRAFAFVPNRVELGPVTSELHVAPVALAAKDFEPLSLVGAWELRSSDPRFGGFSALVIDQGRLLALTDRGALASFSKPGSRGRSTVSLRELPEGPGDKSYLWNRDSEALALDPLGRGWWVTFEVRHELFLYDPSFTRGLTRIRLGTKRWPLNQGVEGLVALPGPELLMFVEASGRVFRMRGATAVAEDVVGHRAGISDATLLPDGRIALIERDFGLTGFRSILAIVERRGDRLVVSERFEIPAGVSVNLEGLAAEAQPNGSTRLWMISDDNFLRPLKTLLLAVDLPPKRTGA